MTIIRNGGLDGMFGWKITGQGSGVVDATTETEDRHININHKGVWSLPFEGIDPVGADDYFFYLKNTGVTNLSITDFRVESSVVGTMEVHAITGTPAYTADADVTPVNRHMGASETPTATIKTDTDITGLTSIGVLFYINLDTANVHHKETTSSNIIIPPGQQVAISWDTATGVMKGMISLVELL